MDIEIQNSEPESFKKTLAKTFASSVVGTAGSIGGLMVVGVVVNKLQERRARKTEASETTEA